MTDPAGERRFERRDADWLPVAEASARVLAHASPLPPEVVLVARALGRALAEEVTATATLPPWDNSAMDGYAVRSADVAGASEAAPVRLRVVGAVRAGEPARLSVGAGEAVRIMTGAPVPEGADTIVRVEDTDAEVEPGRVVVRDERDRGRHIRAAGQDMLAGETLLAPGRTVTPGVVGLLAAAGRERVEVHARPTVGVLSNGDELRDPTRYDDVREGRGIPDSNRPMLAAMVEAAGGHAVDLGAAEDRAEDLRERLLAGGECDVLITIGGASMGDADLVKRVLDELGFRLDFWRVRMRPGSPFGFGLLPHQGRSQPVFSLPGNPASSFVTFEVFVRPFLRALGGHTRLRRRRIVCAAADPIDVPASLTHFHRVVVGGTPDAPTACLTGAQGSGLVSGLALAEGLAVFPPETSRVEVGDPVEVLLLDADCGDGTGP